MIFKVRQRLKTHPGEILLEEFMQPLGLTAGKVAKALGVPRGRIEKIVRQQKGMGPDTALRLARLFGTTTEFWMNAQMAYDISKVEGTIDLSGITPIKTA